MRFDRFHRLATIGTVLLGLSALFLSGEFGLAVVVPAIAVSLAGPFFWRSLDRPWLGPASGGVALVAGVVALLWALSTTDYLYAAIVYALFLSGLKVLFLRRAADFMQMYVLSFLQIMAAAVVNPGMSFGVVMLPYVVFLTLALMLTNLRRGIEAQATAPGGAGGPAAEAVRLNAALSRRDLVRPGFVTATVAITVGVFLVSLLFFFLFPRLGLGFFAQQSRRGMAVTGFSEEVRLGDFGNIAEDPEVVIRVKLKTVLSPERTGGGGGFPQETPAGAGAASGFSRTGVLRMRGQSLDRYDGTTWHKTTARRRQLEQDIDGRLRVDGRRDHLSVPGVEIQEVYLEPMLGSTRVLFGVPQVAAFERPSSALEALRPDQWRFHADEAGDVSLTGPPDVAIVYTVFSDPRPGDPAVLRLAGTDYPAAIRETYLPLPPQQAAVQDLAGRLSDGNPNPYDLARKIESYLKDNYTYSLSSSHGDTDPLADFLLVNREGHCEYFASAMVVLLRLAGVPARIVNGFYGGVANSFGNYVALRRADAHSWVEAYFPGQGWATFDPTPASALDLRSGRSWMQGVTDAIDAARLTWYQWVVEYNLEKQITFLASVFQLRRSGEGFGDSLKRQDFREMGDRLRDLPWSDIGLGFLGLLLGGAGFAVGLRRWRRRGVRVALLPPHDPVLRAYLRLRRILSRAGLRRERSETQLEFADRVSGARPEAADAVTFVTLAYVERAFGPAPAGTQAGPPDGLEARVDEAARAVARTPAPPASRLD